MHEFLNNYSLIDPSKVCDELPTTILIVINLFSFRYELTHLNENKETV